MNAWESKCRMCGKKLVWDSSYLQWTHVKDNSIHCFEKASVATPERSEGTQRYIDSGEYEGEYERGTE